jgi:hypothetical protein
MKILPESKIIKREDGLYYHANNVVVLQILCFTMGFLSGILTICLFVI